MSKKWNDESRQQFSESVERFKIAMSECNTKGQLIEIDFKNKCLGKTSDIEVVNEVVEDSHDVKMSEIASNSGAVYDGGGDNRVFLSDEYCINVYAPALGYNRYRTMEKEIKEFEIKREKYTVYVWNDNSGWMYWKNDGGCNYIQVTAYIDNTNLSNEELKQLENDLYDTHAEFSHYESVDEYLKQTMN